MPPSGVSVVQQLLVAAWLCATPWARSVRARPQWPRAALQAKAYRVHDSASLAELMDRRGVPLGKIDVRGDTAAIRESGHPVMEALRQRTKSGSRPGQRRDSMRIGLAIEGGGMRGAVGAGMVAALNELGLCDAFDAVYGSSAGALVGAYFVSRQLPRYGCSVYYECLGNAESFIRPVQLVRSVGLGALRLKQWLRDRRGLGPPVLDLSYLLVDVMQHERPLDWAVFWERNKLQPLRVLASSIESQEPRILTSDKGSFDTVQGLEQCLRASMLLPGITGPPVVLDTGSRKEPLADAVLTEPIPYRAALADGCTHVVVLRTKADGSRVTKRLSLGEALIARCVHSRPGRCRSHDAPILPAGAILGASSSTRACCSICSRPPTSAATQRTFSTSMRALSARKSASRARIATASGRWQTASCCPSRCRRAQRRWAASRRGRSPSCRYAARCVLLACVEEV